MEDTVQRNTEEFGCAGVFRTAGLLIPPCLSLLCASLANLLRLLSSLCLCGSNSSILRLQRYRAQIHHCGVGLLNRLDGQCMSAGFIDRDLADGARLEVLEVAGVLHRE